MRQVTAKGVDEYLARVPDEARAALARLRRTIKAAAPKAAEVISYQIPTFRYHGSLVGFAAFKSHCSLFVMSGSFIDAHKDILESYETAKSAIHFQAGQPLPASLVKKIVKARMKENEALAAVRVRRKQRATSPTKR